MHSWGFEEFQSLILMEGRRGGSSTPSYKEAVASREKSPLGNVRGSGEEGKKY